MHPKRTGGRWRRRSARPRKGIGRASRHIAARDQLGRGREGAREDIGRPWLPGQIASAGRAVVSWRRGGHPRQRLPRGTPDPRGAGRRRRRDGGRLSIDDLVLVAQNVRGGADAASVVGFHAVGRVERRGRGVGTLSSFRDGVDHLFVAAVVASGVRRAGIYHALTTSAAALALNLCAELGQLQRAVAFVSRLRDLFARRRLEREADQEIEMHLDLLAAQYVRAGSASRRGPPGWPARKFGGVTQVKGIAPRPDGVSDARIDRPRRALHGAGAHAGEGVCRCERADAGSRPRRQHDVLHHCQRVGAALVAVRGSRRAGRAERGATETGAYAGARLGRELPGLAAGRPPVRGCRRLLAGPLQCELREGAAGANRRRARFRGGVSSGCR